MDRLNEAAKELSAASGQECLAAQGDVREPAQLQDAVAKTIARFGRIDFVICGTSTLARPPRRRLISHGTYQQVPLETSWLLSQACPKMVSGL